MAENEEETVAQAAKGGGGMKKVVMVVAALALGAFGAKTFLLKPPPLTGEQRKAKAMSEVLAVWSACARENGVPFDVSQATAEFETWYAQHEHAAGLSEAPRAEVSQDPGTATDEGLGRGGLRLQARVVSSGGVSGPSILTMDSITINLAEEHYLKVGVALQLKNGTDPEDAKTMGVGAPAQDKVIETLSGRTMEELTPTGARTQLREQIGYDLCKSSMGEIRKVYFTDFVMQ